MNRRPPNAGKGRRKGVPNKATVGVRKAFQMLVEGNIEDLQAWLTDVAEGIKEVDMDGDGHPICDEKGQPVLQWLIRPDPGAAFKLVLDLAEYHIPKLARMEHAGTITVDKAADLSDDELARIAATGSSGALAAPTGPEDTTAVHPVHQRPLDS